MIAHFLGGHDRVGPIQFGAMGRRYEPAPGNGNTGDLRGMIAHTLFPAIKVHGTGKGSQHHELGKGDLGALAISAVALKVSGRSLGRPKMKEPSTRTPWLWKVWRRSTRLSPAELKSLKTFFRPSGVTDSTPTRAPLMRAARMASRKSGSSAASMVIWVKKIMSDGSCASRAINWKRSWRRARNSCRRAVLPCSAARRRSVRVTG